MPPKNKAGVKKNLKPTAAAGSKRRLAADLRLKAGDPLEDLVDEDTSSAASKRRLGRRDTEDAVERLVTSRLARNIPADVLAGRRNNSGQSIRDILAEEVRKTRKNGGRLSSKFWSCLRTDFQLDLSVADLLPPGEDLSQEEMDSELLDRLNLIHHENPAARKSEPFIQYMGMCGELRYAEFALTLRAIQESSVVHRTASTKLSIAVLGYIARMAASSSLSMMGEDLCLNRGPGERVAKATLSMGLSQGPAQTPKIQQILV